MMKNRIVLVLLCSSSVVYILIVVSFYVISVADIEYSTSHSETMNEIL